MMATFGDMWHTIRNADGSWQPSYGLVEGQEENNPGPFLTAACAAVGDSLHVVGLTTPAEQMWHTIRNPDGTWQPSYGLVEGQEQNDPGGFIAVACAGYGGDLYVIGLTALARQLWYTVRNADGTWQPNYLPLTNDGPFWSVGCAFIGSQLHVVALTETTGQMWYTNYDIGTGVLSPWEILENGSLNNPAPFFTVGCTAIFGDSLLVVANCADSSGVWRTTRYNDQTWQPCYIQVEEGQSAGTFNSVSCAATSDTTHVLGVNGVDSGGSQWYAARHPDGSIWQPYWVLVESQEQNNPGPFGSIAAAAVGEAVQVVGITSTPAEG